MSLKIEYKAHIEKSRIIGEFIGTLEGIILWEIPDELKKKLQKKIALLRKQK